MGCISSKASAVKDSRGSPTRRSSSITQYSDPEFQSLNSSRREEREWTKERLNGSTGVKVVLIDKKTSASMKSYYDDHTERKKTDMPDFTVLSNPNFGRIPKATEGEQVAAGWPRWLSSVAAEALNGWLPRRADTFEKLNKIGQGTYSSVYKARDVIHKKLVALKKVRFDNLDAESVKFMAREIIILRRLDHPNIIKLEGLIASPKSCSLYLVFEYMEHDLTGLASRPGLKFTEQQVKCYMQQLLSGLEHCHNRGVLHRDIKGSNLLVDNNGILKIADFGLASFYDPHHSVPLTNRVVTLWYRPPELLLGASHYGVAVDLWSTGCILGELYTGRPILPAKTEVEQLHKIFKLCGSPSEDYWSKLHLRHSTVMKPPQPYRRCLVETFKDLPLVALQLMDTLLSIDPASRKTATFALKSEFFTTQPLPCDPSNLPKYPPSKEIDAKLREEEARRHEALDRKDQKFDLEKRRMQRETRVTPVADSNVGRRPNHATANSRSEVFNTQREKTFSGFLIDPTKQSQAVKDLSKDFSEDLNMKASLSGPLFRGLDYTRSGREHNDPLIVPTKANLSNLSGLVAARTTSEDQQEKPGPSRLDTTNPVRGFSGSVYGGQSKRKHDQRPHKQRFEYSRPMDREKACTKDSSLHGHGSGEDKIYVSGPLLVSSNNIDQLLKERDQRIQDYARRTRHEKARPGSAVNTIFASRNAVG